MSDSRLVISDQRFYNHGMAVEDHRQNAPASVRCAVLTISDTRTRDTDTSGEAIALALTHAGHTVVRREIVRDDPDAVRELVSTAAIDTPVVITTGGTGITSRDSTYEAIASLLDKR